jgi:hypothetical protein
MNRFPRESEAVFRALLRVWGQERFVVVGAAAIACHTGLRWRGTLDLDLSVSADVEAYTHDLESLGYKRDRAHASQCIRNLRIYWKQGGSHDDN